MPCFAIVRGDAAVNFTLSQPAPQATVATPCQRTVSPWLTGSGSAVPFRIIASNSSSPLSLVLASRASLVLASAPVCLGLEGLVAHLSVDFLLTAAHHQVTRFTAEVARPGFCIRRLTARPPPPATAITDTVSKVVLYPDLQLVKKH